METVVLNRHGLTSRLIVTFLPFPVYLIAVYQVHGKLTSVYVESREYY